MKKLVTYKGWPKVIGVGEHNGVVRFFKFCLFLFLGERDFFMKKLVFYKGWPKAGLAAGFNKKKDFEKEIFFFKEGKVGKEGIHPNVTSYNKNKNRSGIAKFVVLPKLIKSLLSLSHGNADVERGFSENAALITDDRSSLSDISINGLRATKDAVKFYGQGKVHEISETIK